MQLSQLEGVYVTVVGTDQFAACSAVVFAALEGYYHWCILFNWSCCSLQYVIISCLVSGPSQWDVVSNQVIVRQKWKTLVHYDIGVKVYLFSMFTQASGCYFKAFIIITYYSSQSQAFYSLTSPNAVPIENDVDVGPTSFLGSFPIGSFGSIYNSVFVSEIIIYLYRTASLIRPLRT